jgi:hypothetical protein
LLYLFFGDINLTKLNYFIFEKLKKKNLGQFSKNYRTFYPKKLSLSSKKYGFRIRDPEKTYSGSRIQGSKRHRIPDPESGSATLTAKNNFRSPKKLNKF